MTFSVSFSQLRPYKIPVTEKKGWVELLELENRKLVIGNF